MGEGPLAWPGGEGDNVVPSAGQYWNHTHPGEGHKPEIRQNTRPRVDAIPGQVFKCRKQAPVVPGTT